MKENQDADPTAKWLVRQPSTLLMVALALQVHTKSSYENFLEKGEVEHWKEKYEFLKKASGKFQMVHPLSSSISCTSVANNYIQIAWKL